MATRSAVKTGESADETVLEKKSAAKKELKAKTSPASAILNPRVIVTLAIVLFEINLLARGSSFSGSVKEWLPVSSDSISLNSALEKLGDGVDSGNPRQKHTTGARTLDKLTVYSNPMEKPVYPATFPLGVVVAQKANLRSGPAKEFAPIMMVSKGTRLAIKKKGAEWLKVLAPSGEEAWVLASSVVIPGN